MKDFITLTVIRLLSSIDVKTRIETTFPGLGIGLNSKSISRFILIGNTCIDTIQFPRVKQGRISIFSHIIAILRKHQDILKRVKKISLVRTAGGFDKGNVIERNTKVDVFKIKLQTVDDRDMLKVISDRKIFSSLEIVNYRFCSYDFTLFVDMRPSLRYMGLFFDDRENKKSLPFTIMFNTIKKNVGSNEEYLQKSGELLRENEEFVFPKLLELRVIVNSGNWDILKKFKTWEFLRKLVCPSLRSFWITYQNHMQLNENFYKKFYRKICETGSFLSSVYRLRTDYETQRLTGTEELENNTFSRAFCEMLKVMKNLRKLHTFHDVFEEQFFETDKELLEILKERLVLFDATYPIQNLTYVIPYLSEKLTVLGISDKRVEFKGHEVFCEKFRNLKKLYVHYKFSRINDFKDLPNLEKLSFKTKDWNYQDLMTGTKPKKFHVVVMDSGFVKLKRFNLMVLGSCNFILALQSLEKLSMLGCSRLSSPVEILESESAIEKIVIKCPKIDAIVLSSYYSQKKKSSLFIESESLTHLHIYRIGFEKCEFRCPNLKTLDMMLVIFKDVVVGENRLETLKIKPYNTNDNPPFPVDISGVSGENLNINMKLTLSEKLMYIFIYDNPLIYPFKSVLNLVLIKGSGESKLRYILGKFSLDFLKKLESTSKHLLASVEELKDLLEIPFKKNVKHFLLKNFKKLKIVNGYEVVGEDICVISKKVVSKKRK